MNHEDKIIVASALNWLVGQYEGHTGKEVPAFVFNAKELLMVECLNSCEVKR